MASLGSFTLLFIIFARPIMTVFAPGFHDNPELLDLTVNLRAAQKLGLEVPRAILARATTVIQ